MFSFSATFQPQVTSQLIGQLINALHSLKNSASSTASASVQSLQTYVTPEQDLLLTEDLGLSEQRVGQPTVNLRDLGLSDLRVGQLDELVNRLLPSLSSEEGPAASRWRTSHVSADSFFQNKHGVCICCFYRVVKRKVGGFWHANVPQTKPESSTCHLFRAPILACKGPEPRLQDSEEEQTRGVWLPGAGRTRGLHYSIHEDSLRRTRLILLVLLVVGIYGLSRSPFLSVRFRTTSGLDSQVDPVQVKSVTFEHVKGVEEAKNELQDVVEFLRNPQKFTVLGGKLPKGILLIGPPGTGKTLLARAVAGEADVPFFYASGSEFDEMFVGVGASRIRNLFKEAKANAPCVVFIDELDSVGGKRIESPMHPYSRQTINQLLAEMDGFKPNEGVIVIGATNFAEALDNALVRPGRFDMQVTVPRPDVKGRTEILNWYLQKIKVDPNVNAAIIARGTVGFTGAELENLVNQAALKAAVDGLDQVTMKELEFSKDKILMGPERRSVDIDKKNKQITAYHESGHAIVAYYTKDAMPINKATIMPRGPTLGHVSMLPENDRWSETRAQLLAQMDVSMGGRVAEELIFGDDYITTGASSDFDGATRIAKMMVTRFGMSDKLGVMTYAEVTKQSPETQAAIEQEVRVLLKDSYERAKNLLKTYSDEHKTLAEALLTYETLDAKEIKLVLEGKALDPR
ncbi:ATP-dependent zinc metalloprotease YME1L1 isoform X4 [Salmo salar]|uniref:ATP-dependent zinc metalloprotease YME1L1 isoform X4 n=1 Tax=Salmo salar TaxID=8030 RepID=A0ABM3DIW8_SALSA|nr:ATP-dependent zinc metalloprotease YME1L1 isoform X4 [Salmo salar]